VIPLYPLKTNTHDYDRLDAGDKTAQKHQRRRQRAFIKIQDGCRYKCTYCIVTKARGEEKSRHIRTLVDEVNALQRQGVQEIVLTGVHVGGYGSDTTCTYPCKVALTAYSNVWPDVAEPLISNNWLNRFEQISRISTSQPTLSPVSLAKPRTSGSRLWHSLRMGDQ